MWRPTGTAKGTLVSHQRTWHRPRVSSDDQRDEAEVHSGTMPGWPPERNRHETVPSLGYMLCHPANCSLVGAGEHSIVYLTSQMRFDAVDADNVPRSHPASHVVQGTFRIFLQIQEMAQHGVSDTTEPVVPPSSCACMRALPAASSVPVPSLTRTRMSQQSGPPNH